MAPITTEITLADLASIHDGIRSYQTATEAARVAASLAYNFRAIMLRFNISDGTLAYLPPTLIGDILLCEIIAPLQ